MNTTAMTEHSILSFDSLELDTHIRVHLREDGEPLFIVKDVCAALGIANSRDAVETLHDDELVSVKATSGGQARQMQAVTESGLYALIFKSRKAEAEKFRRWVTGEVLPAIRKHGRYDPVELAKLLPPRARLALLQDEMEKHERALIQLRAQADLALVIPGQLTVWQWLLKQGEEPSKGNVIGRLSFQCRRLAQIRGVETGQVKVVEHAGQITRLSRTAFTFPEAILEDVCGRAA